MARFRAVLKIVNARRSPRVVIIEPWGEDYTLLSGEEADVVALCDTNEPSFTIVELDDAMQVFCERTSDFKVMQGERTLACGHQRQL